MLTDLIVRNFAVIRNLEVSFGGGLTMITGETGAGKSILVGAVNLMLGARASQDMIRTGTDEAVVEAQFDLTAMPELARRLAAAELPNQGALVIRRAISRAGRNRIVANGRLISLQQLQELTRGVISVSGQHEHQLLLDPGVHLGLLDRFADLLTPAAAVAAEYSAWQAARNAWQQFQKLRRDQAQQLEFIKFQLHELECAALQPDEDLRLAEERRLLQHAATLHGAATSAHRLLYSDSHAVLGTLTAVAHELDTLCRIDPRQAGLRENLDQARIHLEELAHGLQQYAGAISFDPYRLTELEDRLAAIQRLTKKYGASVADLIARTEELRAAVSACEDPEWRERELQSELTGCRRRYLERAHALSRQRRSAAERLTRELEPILAELDLPRARFGVRFQPENVSSEELPESLFGETGIDQVEFLLSANPGEDLKPLARIASGGELSRILLALKSLLSGQGQAETLIFDEVDTGIGGRTAELVGRQLLRLAGNHQVLCITHLPQIACYGDHHLRVAKTVRDGETETAITPLSARDRVEELARMLGGVSISTTTRDHARELLDQARAQPI